MRTGRTGGAARPGRPRAFDADVALDQALRLFWQKGFEGTSLTDLTAAMGINRPSLYAAFGNKEQLFRAVLDRYTSGTAAYTREALQAPTARQVVQQLLAGAIRVSAGPSTPAGCLLVQSALACGDDAAAMQQEVAARRAAAEIQLRERLERARTEGDLPPDADPADLARYISAVLSGIAVQAAGGAGPAELERVARLAMRALPSVDHADTGIRRSRGAGSL